MTSIILPMLLIFRAVAEPRNSGKSAKSREIHKNTQNTAKFGRNLIKYMSVQQFFSATGGIYLPETRKFMSKPHH